jgi:16S rRNA (cytidine1402-2'-O)-methyltransferase
MKGKDLSPPVRMQNKRLFLIPVSLSAQGGGDWIGPRLREAVTPLRRFVVEHPKSARQFLKALGMPLLELELEVLDEHSKEHDVDRLVRWMEAGNDTGLLAEAGCPAVADPGAALVRRAHGLGIQVVPLVGPSSIVMALMASGLNGQRFAFNGYLPQNPAERDKRIRDLEARSRQFDQTEIFIEAPYRNDSLFKAITATCDPNTLLSVATDLTTGSEEICMHNISQWRQRQPPQLHKRPTVFLLLAAKAGLSNRGKTPAHMN